MVLDHDRFRKKREDDTISIRKQKREETNLKRRMIAPSVPETPVVTGTPVMQPTGVINPNVPVAAPAAPVAVLAKMPVEGSDSFTNPQEYIAAFTSPNPQDHLRAAHHIRRLLSLEKSPPIDLVIKSGCLPHLVRCLDAVDNQKLQFEAAWALTNVASGESRHTNALVESGAVPPLLRLLNSTSWEIREQAVWALGNIAGDGAALRDQLLNCGAMEQLIRMMYQILQEPVPVSLVRNTAWTLSNMYRGKPSPPLALVQPGLPLLKILLTHPDDEVVIDTIWAVSYATECNSIDKPTPSTQLPSVDARIDAVAMAGILPEIYKFLSASELSKALPAVRTFGNILTGSAQYTDLVLEMNILPPFLGVLKRKNRVIRKEVLWALSNVAAGTPKHVQALIDNGVIDTAYNVIKSGEFDLQKEAGWLISNAAVCATPEQVHAMVESHSLLESLAEILKITDTPLLKMALSSIDSVLQNGRELGDPNPYAERMDGLNITDSLTKLQDHKNQKVYDSAFEIMKTYFEEDEADSMDEDSVDATGAPQNTPAALNFGPNTTAAPGAPQFSFNQNSTFSFTNPPNPGQTNFFGM